MDFDPRRLIAEHLTFAPEDAETICAILRAAYPKETIATLAPAEAVPLFANLQSLITLRAIAGDHFEPREWPGYPEITKDYGRIDEAAFDADIGLLHAVNCRLGFSKEFAAWLGDHMRGFWTGCKTAGWFVSGCKAYGGSSFGLRSEFAARIMREFFDRLYADTRVDFMPPMLAYEAFGGWTAGMFNADEDKITVSENYKNEDAFCDLLETLSHEMAHSAISQLRKIKKPTARVPFPADIELSRLKHEHKAYADSLIQLVYRADSEEMLCRAQSDILFETMRPDFGFRSPEDLAAEPGYSVNTREIKDMLRRMPWERQWRAEDGRPDHEFMQQLKRPLGFLPPDKK